MTPKVAHACHSDVEKAVCREMERQEVPHEHRSLRFRIQDEQSGSTKYEPAIVARRGSILFLVEAIATPRDLLVERLTRFLEQHSPEIVLVIVTSQTMTQEIPPEAYDEIYAASDIGKLAGRIREQDPEGIVRPFPKPHPPEGQRPRDTAK